MGKIRSIVKQNPAKAEELLQRMKSGMDQLASKAIHSGVTEKYTSINTKNGYIEFRSPGGDWLDDNFAEIENTLRRFTVALSAAVDPAAYRQEYLKKLYKLLNVNGEKDPLSYFAKYAAGELPKAALKSFVRQAQLQRGVKRGEETGPMWWRVYKEGKNASNGAVIEVVASSKEEALDKAAKEWGVFSDEYRRAMYAEPVRPYKQETKGPELNGRPSNPDGNYIIVNAATQAPAYRYMASDMTDATLVLRQWITANPGTQWDFKRDPEMRLGQPGQQQSQGVDTRVDYELYSRASGAVIDTFPARNDDEAQIRLNDYRQHGAGQSNPDNFGVRRAASGSASASTTASHPEGRGRPNNPTGRYGIVARSDQAAYGRTGGPPPAYQFRFDMANLEDQGHGRYVLQAWAARNSVNPADYIVVDTTQYADAAQGGTIDVATDQPAPQPAGMGQWNGQWKVLVNGQEVYRFGNIGNSQADANRIAAAWLRQNGQGVSGEGFEVYPVMDESLTESNNLHLRDFVVTISPHALEQCYNRNIDPDQVDDILKNISQAKSSIMGQGPGVPFILHDGQGTALGMRRHPGNRLTLATVYRTSSDFVKGKYPTFKIAAKEVDEGQDRFGNFDPPGPETPPTMPAGTVKVDVSDVYDWYKLGQHISNMKDLGQHDFGQGPPSAILSFGDEDLEHQYIQALKRTGLTTTDIDPVDPDQPPGMSRQKTDPTYNVDENFADGKNPGRKGLSKRVGVNTKASVSDLRKTAKNSSGEKQRMAHWLANMKAGRAKAKRK
jgi:hypothetical protein